jgi:hypothetical protein
MVDILLMVVIGGMGTIYGAIIGATIFILAQNYLQSLMGVASKAASEAACRCCRGCFIPTAGCSGSGYSSLPACILPDRRGRTAASRRWRQECGRLALGFW